MKIGLVSYQGSGKSTLFEWLTQIKPDPALAHSSQSAMAVIPDHRVEPLCEIYQPKKITLAQLELVDTPGLSRMHEGNAARLAQIREAGCLVVIVAAFDRGADPISDLKSFEEDLLLADLEIVMGRIERLRESIKKPRPDRDQQQAELAALQPIAEALGQGQGLQLGELTNEQQRMTRSFQLLTQKPRFVILNVAEDAMETESLVAQVPEEGTCIAVPLRLELELAQLEPEEREHFLSDLEIQATDRDGLLQRLMDISNQLLFFTAGDKEVRTWLLRKGASAIEAAGNIHTDMARGFIRAETMKSEDLIRLGSERKMKAENLVRQEPKDYIIEEGDVLLFRFNV